MLGVSSYWQEIVKGLIIIIAVIVDEQKIVQRFHELKIVLEYRSI